MNKTTKKMLCLGLIVLMLTGGLPLLLPSVSATNDPPVQPMGTTNVNGDWTVLDTRTYGQMQTINMANGNVRVASGGRLTLDFAAIRFNSASHNQRGITVEEGGYFEMRNFAILYSNTAFSFYCQFLSGSTIKLVGPNTNIRQAGGIHINTVNATIDQMTFTENIADTPLVILNNDVTITNSTFTMLGNYGVLANAPHNVTIYDSNFGTSNPPAWQAGIYVNDGTNATLENNKMTGMNFGIEVGARAYLKAKNNLISNNTERGVTLNLYAKADLIDNTINDNPQGIRTDIMSEVNMWGHNRMFSNNDGVSLSGLSNLNSKGTEFRDSHMNNLYISGGTINITGGLMVQTVGQTHINMMALSTGTVESTDFVSTTTTSIGVGSGSTLMMNKCNFNMNFNFPNLAATTGSTLVLTNSTFNKLGGMMAFMEGTILSSNNTFIEFNQMFFSYAQSTVISRNDQGKSAAPGAGVANSMVYSTVDIENIDVNLVGPNTVIGAAQDHSTLDVMDSTTSQSNMALTYVAVDNSHVTVINAPADPTKTLVDETGIIDFGWHTQVRTFWQNNAVAPLAQVVFNNQTGFPMSTLITDSNGQGKIDIIATTVDFTGVIEHNDYNLTATLNGMSGKLRANISDNMVGAKLLTVKITDTDNPLVNITVPDDKLITKRRSRSASVQVRPRRSNLTLVGTTSKRTSDWTWTAMR
jgi:parallel beta-helix repeat protein